MAELNVVSPVDPTGQPVARAALENAYAECKKAYQKQMAEKWLNLQPG